MCLIPPFPSSATTKESTSYNNSATINLSDSEIIEVVAPYQASDNRKTTARLNLLEQSTLSQERFSLPISKPAPQTHITQAAKHSSKELSETPLRTKTQKAKMLKTERTPSGKIFFQAKSSC